MTAANLPKLLGITDEVTTCDCCGKENLKRTFAISLDGDSDPVYFGSTCGARALRGKGYSITGRQIETQGEKLAFAMQTLGRYRAGLTRYEAMIAVGRVRYPIGADAIGSERGALLAELLISARHDVAQYEATVAKLGVL